jgi:hypothetical protein
MIKKDELSEYYHCFLIPGKGNDNISKLHDLLYSEKLKQYLRTDIEYLPHINIGNSKDKNSCEKMVSKWNAFDYCITGSISKLSVVSYNNSVVTLIKELELSVE